MGALIIAFLVALSIGPVAAWAGPRAVVEHLSSLGSRVAGYPGSAQAAEYVEGQLQALDWQRDAIPLQWWCLSTRADD